LFYHFQYYYLNIGCKGDYSSFSQLGQEVNNAITTIKQYLGNHTEIVLLGHSLSFNAFQVEASLSTHVIITLLLVVILWRVIYNYHQHTHKYQYT
jgi:hypothetical protein